MNTPHQLQLYMAIWALYGTQANLDKRKFHSKKKHLYTGSTDARSIDTDKQRKHTLPNEIIMEPIIVCQFRVEGSEEMQALANRHVCPGFSGMVG